MPPKILLQRLLQVWLRYYRRHSMVEVEKERKGFGQCWTNSFEWYRYCRTLQSENPDQCGYRWIWNPVSHGNPSTQLWQTCNHWRLGAQYTQQVTAQGLWQYLQPFEACRHSQFHKVAATQVANRGMTVRYFTVIPYNISKKHFRLGGKAASE